jgi:hypothetical protein
LRKPLIHLVTPAGQASRAVAVEDAVFDRSGIRSLAVADQFDQQFTVPVTNDGGGAVMMAPAIEDLDLAQSADLRWHVNLELLPSAMPRGAGLMGRCSSRPARTFT